MVIVLLQLGLTVTPDPESIAAALDSNSGMTASGSTGTTVDLCCLNLPNIVEGWMTSI